MRYQMASRFECTVGPDGRLHPSRCSDARGANQLERHYMAMLAWRVYRPMAARLRKLLLEFAEASGRDETVMCVRASWRGVRLEPHDGEIDLSPDSVGRCHDELLNFGRFLKRRLAWLSPRRRATSLRTGLALLVGVEVTQHRLVRLELLVALGALQAFAPPMSLLSACLFVGAIGLLQHELDRRPHQRGEALSRERSASASGRRACSRRCRARFVRPRRSRVMGPVAKLLGECGEFGCGLRSTPSSDAGLSGQERRGATLP